VLLQAWWVPQNRTIVNNFCQVFTGQIPFLSPNKQYWSTEGTYYMLHTYTQLFYGPFAWTTWVSRCQRKTSCGLYGAREDDRGRHTDHLDGRHSIWTNQRPTSITLPHFFTPDAIAATTLPVYPGLGQAPNMLVYISSGMVHYMLRNTNFLLMPRGVVALHPKLRLPMSEFH